MPFLLISRDDDDQLRLLTTSAAASRQDALAELSRLTADPAFDGWDDDVLLLDLDSGLPVLLVRPTASASEPVVFPVEEPASAAVEEEPEVITFVAPSNETEEWRAVAVPASVAGIGTEIPAEEADAFAAYVAPVIDEEASSVALLADETDVVVDDSYPLPPLAAELTEEPVGETVSIPIEESIADDSFETLEVPDLIEEEAELAPVPDEIPTAGLGDEVAALEESDDEESNGLREALERTAVVMAAEAAAAAALEDETVPELEEAEPPAAEVVEPAVETWPWDVATAAPTAETPVEPIGTPEQSPMPESLPDEEPEAPVEDQPEAFAASDETSDFLADLEPIPSAGAAATVLADEVADVRCRGRGAESRQFVAEAEPLRSLPSQHR